MGPLHGKFSLIDLAGKEHGHIAKLNSYAAKDALIFLLQSIYISTSTICIFAFLALWPLPWKPNFQTLTCFLWIHFVMFRTDYWQLSKLIFASNQIRAKCFLKDSLHVSLEHWFRQLVHFGGNSSTERVKWSGWSCTNWLERRYFIWWNDEFWIAWLPFVLVPTWCTHIN